MLCKIRCGQIAFPKLYKNGIISAEDTVGILSRIFALLIEKILFCQYTFFTLAKYIIIKISNNSMARHVIEYDNIDASIKKKKKN